jgi:peptidoglycan/LPS O-acetylase OafA/YrhL
MLGVLATCGTSSGSSRVFGIVLPPLIVAFWGWVIWRVASDIDRDARLKVFSVFAVAAVVGAVIFLFPHGFSGNRDYLNRFWFGLGAAVILGAIAALLPPRVSPIRSVLAAIAGDVFLPGGAVLLLVWALALSGDCLD